MEVEPKVELMLRLFFRKVEYKGYFIGGAGLFFSMGKKNSAFRDQRSGTAVHSCPRTVTGNRAFSVTYRKIHPSFPPPFFRFSINFTQMTLIKNRPKANNVVTPGYTLNPEKDKKKTTQMDVVFFLSETHFYWRTRLLIPVQMGSDRSRAENRECSST